MIQSILGRVNEDWGKIFKLVTVDEIEALGAEDNLLKLMQPVKQKLLSTPNPRHTDQDQTFKTNLDYNNKLEDYSF